MVRVQKQIFFSTFKKHNKRSMGHIAISLYIHVYMKLYIHVQIFYKKIQVKLEFGPYSMIYDGDMPIELGKKIRIFQFLLSNFWRE